MSEQKYYLHDPFEPGFYLSSIEQSPEGKREIVTTAADKYKMWFSDKEEVETLAKLYELEVEEGATHADNE